MTAADTVKNIQQDLTALAQSLLALGKLEGIAMGKRIGLGVALLLVAAYFALNAVSLLFISAALAIFLLLVPDASQDPTVLTGALPLGFVIMGGLLLVVTAVLALAGVVSIKKNQGVKRTTTEAKASVAAVKSAVERGKADVAVRLEYGEDDADQVEVRASDVR